MGGYSYRKAHEETNSNELMRKSMNNIKNQTEREYLGGEQAKRQAEYRMAIKTIESLTRV